MCESLRGVNVWSFHLYMALVTDSNVDVLVSGHTFSDADADAMGCVRRQEHLLMLLIGLYHE